MSEANPYVPELDMFTKKDNETPAEYLRNAISRRLSCEVTETYMKYVAAVNRYQEMMRLIEAYKEENNG